MLFAARTLADGASSGTLDMMRTTSLSAAAAEGPPAGAERALSGAAAELLAECRQRLLAGDLAAARRLLARLPAAEAENDAVIHLEGLIHYAAGEPEAAAARIAAAIARNPGRADYYHDLAAAFRAAGALDRAAACARRAVELDPGRAERLEHLSACLRAGGRTAEAVVSAKRAVDLDPARGGSWFALGLAFQTAGVPRAAAAAYRRLTRLDPRHAAGFGNLGAALFDLGRLEESAEAYGRALEINPDYPEALNGLAVVRRLQGRLAEALALGRRALAQRPDFLEAAAHLAVLCQLACDWQALPDLRSQLERLNRSELDAGRRSPEQPMAALWAGRPPGVQLEIARSWSRAAARRLTPRAAAGHPARGEGVLRIGYLSSDFRNHPVGHQLLGVLRRHDRERFRVIAYATAPDDGSRYRRAAAAHCDALIDLTAFTDAAAAARIAADGIDILVDLNVHSAGGRLGILARRPAPIQVNFLGYPGTAGSDYHDYLITDRLAAPEELRAYFTEKFVWMPHSGMATDDRQPIAAGPVHRADFGLPEKAFVFCAFNSFWKIDAELFESWMTILREVPHALLWLPGGNAEAARNLVRAAERCGVAAGRLRFAPKLADKADHLARLRLADLALDTRVYNGHVSTCDALWAGVPVLALMGEQLPARASAGMLVHAGLPELIAGDLSGYRQLAIELALCPAKLKALRARLEQSRAASPLFDTGRFTADLERAFQRMAQLHRRGLPPQEIALDAA
jgi:predicted O-linked N-acetylglucosamine transferase (SPINDLY family)